MSMNSNQMYGSAAASMPPTVQPVSPTGNILTLFEGIQQNYDRAQNLYAQVTSLYERVSGDRPPSFSPDNIHNPLSCVLATNEAHNAIEVLLLRISDQLGWWLPGLAQAEQTKKR